MTEFKSAFAGEAKPTEAKKKDAIEVGVVQSFKLDRGYGWITREGGPDLFFHISAVRNKPQLVPTPGDRVEFFPAMSTRGPCAMNVIILPRK